MSVDEQGRQERPKVNWVAVMIAVLFAGWVISLFVTNDDDQPARVRTGTGEGAELKVCPDFLEVAGPYRRGIDPEYRASMDWDGDGVSCEG